MDANDRRDEPFCWWGPAWSPRDVPALADLVEGGVLSLAAASLLASAMARRASVVVVARAAGAGKTTLLTSLLPFLPPETRKLYPRGQFESFAFLDDPSLDPAGSAVLANEIGPHLPQYLWGEGVARFLALRERGFCLGATAHANGVEELAAALAGPPLRLPPASLAAFDVLVAISDREVAARVREIDGVWALGPGSRGALRFRLVARHDDEAGAIAEALAHPDQPNRLLAGIGADELARMAGPVLARPAPERPSDRPGAMLATRERALRSRPSSP